MDRALGAWGRELDEAEGLTTGNLGAAAERRTYRSFAAFGDPDGNGWLLQEITTRLPGR